MTEVLQNLRYNNMKVFMPGTVFYGNTLTYNTNESFEPAPIDYSKEYFTIESLEDNNTITLTKQSSGVATLFYYSTDDGTTWTNHTTSSTPWTIDLNTGDKVLMKSNVKSWCYGGSNTKWHRFSSTKNFDVHGNIMSMTWGDDFIGKTAFQDQGSSEGNTSAHCFEHLFHQCTHLIHAHNLILPALSVPFAGYGQMFNSCSGLLTAPKLLATYGYEWAYAQMFQYTYITEIVCLLTSWLNNNTLDNFIPSGTNGTCYKDPNTTLPRGSQGVPNDWTILNYEG